jgi:hypothetical protein
VTGLAKGSGKQALGSGGALEMPASRPSSPTAAVLGLDGLGVAER